MTNCQSCNHEMSGKYCSNCGRSAQLIRINGHYIVHEIEHVLHFEKGILYTIKELLLRPGESVKNFISKDRSRLVKPIIFIIVTSLIYSIVNQFFHIEDGYISYNEANTSTTGVMLQWVKNHYGYGNIIMAIFIALFIKIFFKKYGYNFFEILILLCFVMGMAMLFFTVFALIEGLINLKISQVGGILAILYSSWAIGQFFDRKKFVNYPKAFGAYLLGMITFLIATIAIGNLIDVIFKS